ncbi:MAG: tRNA dihydrouridine synthase DusB [Evtepia sp.]
MQIGSVHIDPPLVLAPMAGVTDIAFRHICRELGAAYTLTEMVSAKALCYQDKKTIPLLRLEEGEHPAGVQIFGSDPACMEQAAGLALEASGADILDINMGCPVPKVANNGDGSGLLRDPDKACRVAEAAIRGAGGKPVTVKMRLGWDKGSIVCLELAKELEKLGVAAITLHGRTKVQMYGGTANWDYIREMKNALSIPVIANGDVFSGQDAARILRYTGADGVMIARGVFGNPWIFQQAKAALAGEEIPPLPPLAQRCDTAVRQFELAAQYKSEKIACLEARKHYAWYLKGVPYAGYWKGEISKITTLEDVYRVTAGIKRELRDAHEDRG